MQISAEVHMEFKRHKQDVWHPRATPHVQHSVVTFSAVCKCTCTYQLPRKCCGCCCMWFSQNIKEKTSKHIKYGFTEFFFFTGSTGKPFWVIAKIRNKSTGIFPQMGIIEEYVEKALLAWVMKLALSECCAVSLVGKVWQQFNFHWQILS